MTIKMIRHSNHSSTTCSFSCCNHNGNYMISYYKYLTVIHKCRFESIIAYISFACGTLISISALFAQSRKTSIHTYSYYLIFEMCTRNTVPKSASMQRILQQTEDAQRLSDLLDFCFFVFFEDAPLQSRLAPFKVIVVNCEVASYTTVYIVGSSFTVCPS